MARKKHRGLGRVALVAGVGLLGWYAYKKGAFDPVKEWWSSLSGGGSTTPDTTPSTTPSETTPSRSDSGGLWDSIIDWIADAFGGNSQGGSGSGSGTGLSDILDTIDGWFDKKKEDKTQTLIEQGVSAVGALGMAAVPVFIGTSPAVAEGLHTANVAITKKLQESGVQKPTKSGTAGTYLYDVVLPGNTTTSRVMIGAHDVVYDLSGSKAVKVTNMDAKTIKKQGTRVQTW